MKKEISKVGRPPFSPEGAADAQIQLRVTRARKGAYVAAARKKGETLAAWAFRHLDRAAEKENA
jgi:hypothetical protein